jgi:hypothetical protein
MTKQTWQEIDRLLGELETLTYDFQNATAFYNSAAPIIKRIAELRKEK